jgi:hypothetical protein
MFAAGAGGWIDFQSLFLNFFSADLAEAVSLVLDFI